jgi:2-polyprenyl-3-methyl-5-hydroxy-6-metoxy-1,4-benzoquinol methylase
MMKNVDPGYYDNFNPNLLAAIPVGRKVVLEIGCGAGRLGMAYKEQNPEARYIGIEIVPEAAAIAAQRLDLVLCGSTEQMDLRFLEGEVDCIVYGDVLEHLVDPWQTLKNHYGLLMPQGQVIASIPNIQNWSILLGLMHGQWAYQENGLLDRTHLRFFTLHSIIQLFQGAGLKVYDVNGVIVDRPGAESFASALTPMLSGLGIDPKEFLETSSVYQYLIKASKE